MGFVSLTMIEKTGTVFETGMKPDLKPVTLDMTVLMGTQGEEKADWTTEWFLNTSVSTTLHLEGRREGVVYLCHKLELNDFSGVGLDVARRESKSPVSADLDDVHLHVGCRHGRRGEQEC